MKLSVELKNKSYDVIIEEGIIKNLYNYINENKKVLIVKDKNVDSKLLPILNELTTVYDFEASEHNKSFESYRNIINVLIEHNFSRSDYIVALGGGVTGDLCGFVASSFKRGIHFINIPTTTLSMVDSSIGGKVAINEGGVKNIVGAFYQPDVVLIDTTSLETLPKRHIFNGLVEALKMGLLFDCELYDIFKSKLNQGVIAKLTSRIKKNNMFSKDELNQIIYKSLYLKKKIVEIDEFERGDRKLLNYGHTIGHAIEAIYLDEIYHGEAVGFGMVYLLKGSLKEEVSKILYLMNGLTIPTLDKDKCFSLILNDKKASNDSIDIVLVDEVSKGYIKTIKIDSLKEML